MRTPLVIIAVLACLPAAAAAPPVPAVGEVLGLLRTRCASCHGPEKAKAGLRLTDADALARGGKSGAAVRPGRPDDSLLWQRVKQGEMPPKKPLAEAERELLRRWIEAGAPGLPTSRASEHWAFRPPVRPPVPAVRHPERVRTVIDRFIEADLERKGESLGAAAERVTLIRRVCFDLTGLPPPPAEVAAFVADRSLDAYERMVERYLASPHYGERWGKYWLDAAGYADSNGYFNADSDRPLAYRYRDYVIGSFNADKPYDRFVREQLAGDELAGYVPGGDVTPAMAELLAATHFLRNAPDGTGESDGNPDEVRTDRFTVLEGNLQVVMNCLLGVTIQCARCHEHKFEPIAHDEYYRLQALLYPVYCPERWVKPNDRVVTVGTRAQIEEHRRRTEQVDRQVRALESGLATAAEPLMEQLVVERLSSLAPATRDAVLHALRTAKDKRSADQRALVAKHVEPLKIGDDDVARRFPEYGRLREATRQAVAARQRERPPPLERLAAFVETDPNPPVHHVLLRGQHGAPGAAVEPGVPAALCTAGNRYRLDPRPPGRVSTGRRTAFARWVTAPENPLFARVMVNRVWQHHFGVGLVATPDNLGRSGARPTHPELLDYLAAEFVRSGWSVKALHRLILRSAVYRQPRALRRLDAEALRDAMLAVSGELDGRAGGPYVATERTADGTVVVDEKHAGARRRSVYLQQRRTQVATLLSLFDAPALVTTCAARTTSTVPLQSLALLNSDFARTRARAFAHRLEREAGPADEWRVVRAFQLTCAREPVPAELAAARRFLAAQRGVYGNSAEAAERVWTDFCQMLLASNAFLYVE